jgi:transposase
VFHERVYQAAQREVIYQDDTRVRILSLIAENRAVDAHGRAAPPERCGLYTTGLVATGGGPTIGLYFSGRAHAGENLAAVLSRRDPACAKPIVMSDALAANGLGDEAALIRANCLQHGRQQRVDIQAAFPAEGRRVIDTLKAVFDHEATTRAHAMSAAARLAYHQEHSGPLLKTLKAWLDEQLTEKLVEPNSSLAQALKYLQSHWAKLTRFLSVAGAPLENNTVERALKLMIRQRKNSLFFATPHGATVGSLLASVIATCAERGVNALDYLAALPVHRHAVRANPAAWLPWNYAEAQATCRQSAAMWA